MSVCTSAAKPAITSVSPDNAHQMQNFRGHQEQTMGTSDQVDTGGDHESGGWISAETGVGPAIASASEVCNGSCAGYRPRRPAASASPTSACCCRQQSALAPARPFRGSSRARFVVRMNSAKARYVTDTGHHEGFHCRRAILRIM